MLSSSSVGDELRSRVMQPRRPQWCADGRSRLSPSRRSGGVLSCSGLASGRYLKGGPLSSTTSKNKGLRYVCTQSVMWPPAKEKKGTTTVDRPTVFWICQGAFTLIRRAMDSSSFCILPCSEAGEVGDN